MSQSLQLVVVIAVVIAAAAYVAFTVWRRILSPKSPPGCGSGCGSCGHSSSSSPNVVPLDSLTASLDDLKSPRK